MVNNIDMIGTENIVKNFLAELGVLFPKGTNKTMEFSWKLKPGVIEKSGRASLWLEGRSSADFLPVKNAIGSYNAPEVVKQQQEQSNIPFRQGIGISADEGEISHRLYLHSKDERKLNSSYLAWQWNENAEIIKHTYAFHFFSAANEKINFSELIPASLLPAFKALTSDTRLTESSGFWLRKNESGAISQVDIAFPWHPRATTLRGMDILLQALNLSEAAIADLSEFYLRHIAFKVGAGTEVTIYTSAETKGTIPATEAEFQGDILAASKETSMFIDKVLYKQPEFSGTSNVPIYDIGAFYDGPVDIWKPILGEKMHYHSGIFTGDTPVNDEGMEAALDLAVRELYPHLPVQGRIYDIGCGWGGPLAMIASELRSEVLGLTASANQYEYVSSQGYNVRLGRAEETLPPGYFDCILMLESLCHIEDKETLLKRLRPHASKIVIRLNCQDNSPASTGFADSLHLISSEDLKAILQRAGWYVTHWRDIRMQTLPTIAMWNQRLKLIPPTKDKHIETLRSWCAATLNSIEEWGRNNPLIEVVAT